MKKEFKILLFLVLLFGLIFCIVYFANNAKDDMNGGNDDNNPPIVKRNTEIVVLNTNNVFIYDEGIWTSGTVNNYAGKDLEIYDDNSYVGKKQLSYSNDKWYIYDNDKNYYNLNGSLFAYVGDYNIKYSNVTKGVLNESEKNLIINYLTKEELTYSFEDLYVDKYSVDVSGNDDLESFITIVNTPSLDGEFYGDSFYISVIVDENGIHHLYKNIANEGSIYNCSPYLHNVIGLDNRNFIFIGCRYPSTLDNSDMIYEFKDNNYKLLLSKD